jgi:hypothetical protein
VETGIVAEKIKVKTNRGTVSLYTLNIKCQEGLWINTLTSILKKTYSIKFLKKIKPPYPYSKIRCPDSFFMESLHSGKRHLRLLNRLCQPERIGRGASAVNSQEAGAGRFLRQKSVLSKYFVYQ